MHSRTILLGAMSVILAAGAVSTASADTTWGRNHPRREEVNDRLQHQYHRIHHERREGEMSARRAHRLHAADRHIRGEERRFARHDDGHITLAEQARLNHQENKVSGEIGR
jgi:hypothetical protein